MNWATSAPGPLLNRPLRETGLDEREDLDAVLDDVVVVLAFPPLAARADDVGMGTGFGIIARNSILITRRMSCPKPLPVPGTGPSQAQRPTSLKLVFCANKLGSVDL